MKRSEIVGNGRKHDQAKTCSTSIFLLISISAQRRVFFFEGPKVSKGKRLETVGDRTFARQKSSCFVAYVHELDDGWPESEKDVFQAALSMVVVKNSRWMVGEFFMSYGGVSCEK